MPFWQCIGGTTKPGLSSVNLRYANQIYELHSLSSRMCYPSPVWPRPERPCPAPSISDPARGSDTKNPRSQNLETLRLDGVRMYQLSNLGMRTHLGMESWMNYNSRIPKGLCCIQSPMQKRRERMEKGNLQFLTQLAACRFSSLSDSAFCLPIRIPMHQQLEQWQCIRVSISLALQNCSCGTVAARVGHWKSKLELTMKWSEICMIH